MDHFITDLSSSQISFRTTNKGSFFSYHDMMDSLRNYVSEEKLCTHEEALAFINNNKLYYQLEYDKDGELNASERLRSSKLSHYLNSKGEIVIGNVNYRLSENDLILKVQGNGN
ncbi:hypothetical protein [Ekhidna sp. To15]|uniref:hypothetical protein n=1 Tax=Ekhidna sp. To15 TaxID=3395267 RepID=UPI003F51E283